MGALVHHTGSPLAPAETWASLDDSERRRRAIAACRDHDTAQLWSLTQAHLLLMSRAGAHLSPHTTRAYRLGVTTLLDAWRDVNLLHPSPARAALYIRSLEEHGHAPATVGVRLAAARALYAALRWATTREGNEDTGKADPTAAGDPFRDVKPARDTTARHTKRGPYTESEFERMCAVAEGSDLLLCLLAGRAGLRCAEIMALRWEHVDLAAGRIVVYQGKGRKTAPVPLAPSVVRALEAAPRTSEYVIPEYRSSEQARRHIHAVCDRAGIPRRRGYAVHSLRHTAGTSLYKRTGKLEPCQELLRHSGIATTQIYVHYSDEELKAAMADW